jgi:hypothetical protein
MIRLQHTEARRGSVAAALLATLLATLALGLASCGGGDDGDADVDVGAAGGGPIAAPPTTTPATPAANAGPAAATTTAPATPAANPGAAAAPAGATGPVIEMIALNDWYRVVLVNPDAVEDPRELEAIARPFCDGLQTCRIGLWYSAADFPRQLPVPGYLLSKQVFAFGRTLTGAENALWNCDVFPELEGPGMCLPRAID